MLEYNVENLVISTHLPFRVNLETLYDYLKNNPMTSVDVVYDPIEFPGLRLSDKKNLHDKTRVRDGKKKKRKVGGISVTIFRTGTIMIAGSMTEKFAGEYLDRMYEVIKMFKKDEEVDIDGN